MSKAKDLAICAIVVSAAFAMLSGASAFAGGDGSALDPYQIADCAQLQAMNTSLTSHYILISDIDCGVPPYSTDGFWPVGRCGTGADWGWLCIDIPPVLTTCFTGSLDGQGHSISNLYTYSGVPPDAIHDYGLFGCVGNTNISNIHLVDVNITAGWSYPAGAIAGRFIDSTLSNSSASGIIAGDGSNIGGLFGMFWGRSSLSRAYSSFSTANVSCTSDICGGFAGSASDSIINNSYARGSVYSSDPSSDGRIGGFIGNAQTSTLMNSYSTGEVVVESGTSGGFLGMSGATVTNCFWDMNTSGLSTSAGGTGKTTAQMTYPYDGENTFSAWDFENWWVNDTSGSVNDGYPYLQWYESYFAGGSGTEEDPYIIDNCSYLNETADFPDSYFSITANLSCDNFNATFGQDITFDKNLTFSGCHINGRDMAVASEGRVEYYNCVIRTNDVEVQTSGYISFYECMLYANRFTIRQGGYAGFYR